MSLPGDLLARVLEAPDDDAPRLVLADALLAANDPRGEFITIQCALAADDRAVEAKAKAKTNTNTNTNTKTMTKTKRTALERSARKLLKAHAPGWKAELGLEKCECTFRRGFIEKVEVPEKRGLASAAWDQSPIRELEIEGRDAFVELLGHPLARQLTSLRIGKCEVVAADLKRMAPTTKIASLTSTYSPWGPEEIAAVATWPSLTALALMVMPITTDLVNAIITSSLGARLVLLDLRCDDTSGKREVAHIVANSTSSWASLRTLKLVQHQINDAGARAIANAPQLANLELLNLALNQIGNDGAKAIATSPVFSKLQTLDLSFNRRMSNAAVFANPKNLVGLRTLDLRYIRGVSKSAGEKLVSRFGKSFSR